MEEEEGVDELASPLCVGWAEFASVGAVLTPFDPPMHCMNSLARKTGVTLPEPMLFTSLCLMQKRRSCR